MKFGTYNKLHLYFQLSETTRCLIGFHGNDCQLYDFTVDRHLGFLNYQILFKFEFLYLKGYSSGQSHFSGYNVKLAEKNEFATCYVQRCLQNV